MILVLKVKVLKKEKCYLISEYVKELQMYLKSIDKNINRSIENKRNTLYVIYYIRIKGIFRLGFQPNGEVNIEGARFQRFRLYAPNNLVPSDS